MFRFILGALLLAAASFDLPAQEPKFKSKDKFGLKKSGPAVGSKAPDFELKYLSLDMTFKLSDNFGKKPTVLIFHSFT